jgi:ankyrin repeat protein
VRLFACAGALAVLCGARAWATGSDFRLVEAAKKADTAAVHSLLAQGVNVDTPYGDGTTALHWAAYRNDVDMVDLLLARRASVNAANDDGATPLWVACSNDNTAVIERLLRAGANPNLGLPSGETPLMTVSRTGNLRAVTLLIGHGADVDARENRRGQNALMWATSQRHADVVRALAAAGADLHGRSRVWKEVVNVGGDGNVFLTTDTLENPPDPVEFEQGGYTPLMFAARQGEIESAQALLEAGANVNDTSHAGVSALVLAIHSGHAGFAAFLLERGADPNAARAGYAPLHVAVLRGNLDLVKALLARGARPNEPIAKPTSVRRASQDFALTNPVIEATPFWLAAAFREVEIMRILAEAGADPLRTVRNEATALLAAVGGYSGLGYRGRSTRETSVLDAARLAVELGVDVNAANVAGDTALHLAATAGFDAVVQFLADRGARLEAKNRKGETPLALTAPLPANVYRGGTGGHKSTADLLRKLGAKE